MSQQDPADYFKRQLSRNPANDAEAILQAREQFLKHEPSLAEVDLAGLYELRNLWVLNLSRLESSFWRQEAEVWFERLERLPPCPFENLALQYQYLCDLKQVRPAMRRAFEQDRLDQRLLSQYADLLTATVGEAVVYRAEFVDSLNQTGGKGKDDAYQQRLTFIKKLAEYYPELYQLNGGWFEELTATPRKQFRAQLVDGPHVYRWVMILFSITLVLFVLRFLI